MVKYMQGNLIEAKAEALVNTVNCVGVMGKGIALQFKQAYPDNFKQYEKACKAGKVQLGQMFIVDTNNLFSPYPRYIINFPTKQHWKAKSRLEDIKNGLVDLIKQINYLNIRSIAVPPLGCGNGGLDWNDVKPLIEEAFAIVPDVEVLLYAPQEAPQADKMPVATRNPGMTPARALLIKLIDSYRKAMPDYKLSSLEIQKLAYFLQESGEKLRLRYEKEQFGPYADNLNHVLQIMEGHYIRGYGDRGKNAEIYLLEGALEAAEAALREVEQETRDRLLRINQLIEGYENPYGMELLATVHWVANETPEAAKNPEVAITEIQNWNEHKRLTLKPNHIRKAWQRLQNEKWLPTSELLALKNN